MRVGSSLTNAVAGSGNGGVSDSPWRPTPGAARTATITVGSQVFTVSQAAAGAASPLTILTSSPLPGGVVSSPYQIQLQATGGTPAYRWAGTSIPSGFSLSTAGLLSGTPTSPGTYSINVSVTDASGTSANQGYSFTVTSAASTTNPQITTSSFPSGSTGQAYKQAVAFTTSCTSPFSPPPTIAVSSGALPPGLSLTSPTAESWIVSGTPTSAGAYTFTMTIKEVCGRTANATFTIVISGSGGGGGGTSGGGAILISPQNVSFTVGAGTSLAPPSAIVSLTSSTGSQVTYTASVVNNTGGSWLSITSGNSGPTPASMTISVSNFQFLAAGTYSAQVALQSSGNATVYLPVTLNVSSAPPISVSPASLVFTSPVLQAPASLQQNVQVVAPAPVPFNVGFATDSQANWLGVTPGNGATPAPLTIVVNPVGLGPGTYTGKVQISPIGGVPVTIPITLVVTTPPALSWSVPAVNSSYITGGPTPLPVTVNLASSSSALQFQVPSPGQATWLSVGPNIGTTPTNITLTFDPTGLAPGVYQTILTASAIGTQTQPVTLPVSFSVQQASPTISAIVNAASFLPAALAPGEEIQIVGSGLGPMAQADATALTATDCLRQTWLGRASTSMASRRQCCTRSDGQITVLVPYEIAGQQSASVVAEYLYAQSAPQSFVAADSNPGLFTAAGSQGVIFNADGSYNSSTNGASPGTIVSILGTGDGQTNPAGIDGLVMQPGSLASTLLPVTALINGEPSLVVSSTSAPGQPAGVFLVQVQVHRGGCSAQLSSFG